MPDIQCAIGIRMHSGWGTLVAVCGAACGTEVIERRRIVISDPRMLGAKQPYHHMAKVEIAEAERYLG